ncbi:GumC family protein [Shimia abyssi]|nr:polysaccharide biosynthesis tyrosine autokinase [Shimia abyssi]
MNRHDPRHDASPYGMPRGESLTDPDSHDIRALFRSLWQKRWRFLLVMLGVGIAVFVLVSSMAPTYTAYAKVVLDPRKAQIVTGNEVVASLQPSEEMVNGEVAVLSSNLLITDVVNLLSDDLKNKLDPALQPKSLMDRGKDTVKSALGALTGSSPAPTPSSGLSEEEQRTARVVKAIRNGLSVYDEPDSFVIVVKSEFGDRELAQVIPNTVINVYLDTQTGARRDAVTQAADSLQAQVSTLEAEVEAAELAVSEYIAKSVLENGGTLENTVEQLSSLNTQLIATRSERVAARARFTQLESTINTRGPRAAANIVDTPTMETLRVQELSLLQEDAEWARSFDETQKRRVRIRDELEAVGQAMEREVMDVLEIQRNELEIAELREASLSQSIANLEAKVIQISGSMLQLKQLEREAAASRQNYQTLLTRLTEMRSQRDLQQADAKLIETAIRPEIPTAPRPKLMAAFTAILAGTVLGAVILFNEMAPTTFRSSHELERATDLPILSALPKLRRSAARNILSEVKGNPLGAYSEGVRQLRTSLDVMGHRQQTVMLTSALQNEGKSTTLLALAQVTAMANKDVIVLDLDARGPSIKRQLGITLENDLSDYINHKCNLSEVIYRADNLDFDVLAFDDLDLQAVEDLSTDWIEPLITELKDKYDAVLIDSPALFPALDALLISQLVDARILVVACESTQRSAVMRGIRHFKKAHTPIDGAVLSMANNRNASRQYEVGSYEYS